MSLMTVEKSFTGTYRGSILDHGVGETSNENPQWIGALHAEEYYDEQEKAWVDLSEYEEVDITAYLVLAGKQQNEIFHCKSLEKAVAWDGASWGSLAALDLSEVKIQFRVEQNTYKENISLQVAGIDHYDAEPGRRVQKLDAADLKALDARYSSFFRNRKGERKPVKAVGKPVVPGTKPAAKPKVEAPEDSSPPSSKKKEKSKAKAKAPKGCSQGDAWAACKEAKDKSISDKKLADLWLETVEKLAPEGDEEQMNNELWARVRDIVSDQVTGAEVAHL